MGAWLTVVSGAIKLLNYLSAALQQHHDEINGVNRERAAANAATAKVNEDVAKSAVATASDDAAARLLRDGAA